VPPDFGKARRADRSARNITAGSRGTGLEMERYADQGAPISRNRPREAQASATMPYAPLRQMRTRAIFDAIVACMAPPEARPEASRRAVDRAFNSRDGLVAIMASLCIAPCLWRMRPRAAAQTYRERGATVVNAVAVAAIATRRQTERLEHPNPGHWNWPAGRELRVTDIEGPGIIVGRTSPPDRDKPWIGNWSVGVVYAVRNGFRTRWHDQRPAMPIQSYPPMSDATRWQSRLSEGSSGPSGGRPLAYKVPLPSLVRCQSSAMSTSRSA